MTPEELDQLAAEKIMGFTSGQYYLELTDHIEWQPTRNISQAWECLEKLNPKYFDVSKTEYSGVPLYVVSVAGVDVGSYDTKATDKDVAVCIVRACLKAKGVEV